MFIIFWATYEQTYRSQPDLRIIIILDLYVRVLHGPPCQIYFSISYENFSIVINLSILPPM